ncbi:MAG TPA: GxxExxY protein [Bacteroidia bacterium]|nr:GxxExxY protein [Bacteroidia bacterium]
MIIHYKGIDIGTRRVDFFMDCNIMLELKAIANLEEIHFVQPLNYLEVYSLPIGLLINFGAKSLEFKRIYNNKHPLNKKSFNPSLS